MPQNDGRQFAALLSTMRRADTIAKGAIAVSRRRQLARLCEAHIKMPPREAVSARTIQRWTKAEMPALRITGVRLAVDWRG